MISPRHTARGLVLHDGKLLLMERWRDGKHYFSIPGGAIEAGETPEQTVEREIEEETTCIVRASRLLYVMKLGNSDHRFYLCEYISGEPQLLPDSPEGFRAHDGNRYLPCWVEAKEVADLPFLVWEPIRAQLAHDLAQGFSSETTEVFSR
jgi:ADP-ribose pyrophosphatase YjhB (NUDIX family)